MLKNISYSIAIFALFTLLGCEKLGTFTIGRDLILDIDVNAVAAGETLNKEIEIPHKGIRESLEEKGKSNKVVLDKIVIKKAVLKLPDDSAWTFADIESVEVQVEGEIVGTYAGSSTIVRKIDVTSSAQKKNLKDIFLKTDSFKTVLKMKAKKATTAERLTLTITTNIEADLLF